MILKDNLNNAKKSLDKILKEKAFNEVEEYLKENGIDIENINEEDLEALVEQKFKDKKNIMNGVAIGGAFTLLLDAII